MRVTRSHLGTAEEARVRGNEFLEVVLRSNSEARISTGPSSVDR